MSNDIPKGTLIERGDGRGDLVTEVTLNRVAKHWSGRGFVIVSAFRLARRVDGSTWEERNVENIEWDRKLRAAIRAAGFGYIPLMGYWNEEGVRTREYSLLVPAVRHGFTKVVDSAEMAELACEWGKLDRSLPQFSVIVAHPGGPVEFWDPATCRPTGSLPTFVPAKVADIYSRIRGKGQGVFVFEGFYWTAPPEGSCEAGARRALGECLFIARGGA